MGQLCKPELLAQDRSQVKDHVLNLEIFPNIRLCKVFDEKGLEIARYGNFGDAGIVENHQIQNVMSRFINDNLHVMMPINNSGTIIGAIYIIKEITPIRNQIRQHLVTMVLVLGVILTISLIVAIRMQKEISKPILLLKNAVEDLTKTSNFKITIRKRYDDDIGDLVDGFNLMVEQLDNRQKNQQRITESLTLNQKRYELLFEESPIGLWEEDFTDLIEFYSILKKSGVKDFRAYFIENPEKVLICLSKIKVLNVNKSALKLFGLKKKDEMIGELIKTSRSEISERYIDELVAIADGKTNFDFEIKTATKKQRIEYIHIWFNFGRLPNQNIDYARVIVAASDITDRKNIEYRQKRLKEKLEKDASEINKTLKEKNERLEGYMKLFTGREYRIKELRDEVKELRRKLSELN
jgi:PAS domain-containing protein